MEILKKTKQVPGGILIERPITELMTCAIITDERGFYMDKFEENWEKIGLHIQAEESFYGATGPQMKLDEIIQSFKVPLLAPCAPFPLSPYIRVLR